MAGDWRNRDARPGPDALLLPRGEEFTALARAELDITDASRRATAVDEFGPHVVVNCSAWTAVDDAEAARGGGPGGERRMAPANMSRPAQRLARG